MPLNRTNQSLRRELTAYGNTLRYLDHEADRNISKNIVQSFRQLHSASTSDSKKENDPFLTHPTLWPCPLSELGPQRWSLEDEVPVIIRQSFQAQSDTSQKSETSSLSALVDGTEDGMLDFHDATDDIADAYVPLLKQRLAAMLDTIIQYRPDCAPSMQSRFHPMSWWHIIDMMRGTDVHPHVLDAAEKRLEGIFGPRNPKFRDQFPPTGPSKRVAPLWKQQPQSNLPKFQERRARINKLRQDLSFADALFDAPESSS